MTWFQAAWVLLGVALIVAAAAYAEAGDDEGDDT